MIFFNRILCNKIHRLIIFLLVGLLLSQLTFAQGKKFTLEGRVIDKQSGEPLVLVNVYLSETTLGAATDKNGNFKISDVPQSLFSLVASAIGYEHQIVAVDLRKGINKFIEIKLTPKTYELGEISVKDRTDENWKKQLQFFEKLFFGNNEFAKNCKIIDPYQINFEETALLFTAEAALPLKILNNALGYEIECILKYFQYDKRKRSLAYTILPKFKEMVSADKDSMDTFLENRKKAYFGSTTHLLSSLAKGKFNYRDEGFVLRLDSGPVGKSDEIVKRDSANNLYYLNYSGCMTVQYWVAGLRSSSKICLKYGSTEFSSDGYLMFPGEFEISGAMTKEGVATQLPRFLEISNRND
ncbi:MAG: carboxypeptidase-like regulatory domain-containing protein [Ignavibacteria bacterium]|nr:carboxypeptidase-like regulatory domain-containing protein [Ignavibacteria bacterium]